jgi:hypothetical protein
MLKDFQHLVARLATDQMLLLDSDPNSTYFILSVWPIKKIPALQ